MPKVEKKWSRGRFAQSSSDTEDRRERIREWRSKYEIEEAAKVKESLREYQEKLAAAEKTGDEETIRQLKDVVQMLESRHKRYEWQKAHPFIAAGLDHEGTKNYEYALEHRVDYGFNLRQPAASFISNYHLKPHDIIGLKVFLEPSRKEMEERLPPHLRAGGGKVSELGYATRAYYKGDTLHLPPINAESPKKTRHTVHHEVGHHVQKSEPLRRAWERGDILRVKVLKIDEKTHRHTGEVEEAERHPWHLATKPREHFYMSDPFDLFEWELESLISGRESDEMLSKEAWAQAFAAYRGGEMKKELKTDKERLDVTRTEYDRLKKKTDEYGFDKRSAEYRRLKRMVGAYEKSVAILNASYENRLTLLNWMRKWDTKKWGLSQKAG